MATNKVNKNRALYFERNAKYQELYFTSNDLAYVSENTAKNEAVKLAKSSNDPKKGEVDKVTRADYEAWKANDGSGVQQQTPAAGGSEREAKEAKLAELNSNLTTMNKAVADANTALSKLTERSKPETKTKYETAKADAEAKVASLQAEINTLTGELEALG